MKKAPDFSLPDQDGNTHSLTQYKGRWIILYFYPRDNTPGCTKEACSFRDASQDFAKKDAVILGVSKDSVESHAKFAKKHNLNFPLLSDPDHHVIESFGAWQEKNMLGKSYMGIVRMTYLIDPEGKVVKTYPKVNPLTHAQEILNDLPQREN